MAGRRTKSLLGGQSRIAVAASVGGLALILVTAALLLFSKSQPHVHLDPSDVTTAAAPIRAPVDAPPGQGGYLAVTVLDAAAVAPPPPAPGSPRAEADRKVFEASRSLQGSARWTMAAQDDDQGVSATLRDFSCALGANANAATAPLTAALFTKLQPNARRTIDTAKFKFGRKRPYLLYPGPICVPKTDDLAGTPDYPSGHASWGWMAALLLAEVAPDRATQLLARGRAYGESRVVCGVHNASSVEAGRVNGSALAATLHGSAAFRVDLEQARAEIERLRSTSGAPEAAKCADEARLVAAPAY